MKSWPQRWRKAGCTPNKAAASPAGAAHGLGWSRPALLQAMLRRGVRVQTASDAHRPEDVGLQISKLEQITRGYMA